MSEPRWHPAYSGRLHAAHDNGRFVGWAVTLCGRHITVRPWARIKDNAPICATCQKRMDTPADKEAPDA